MTCIIFFKKTEEKRAFIVKGADFSKNEVSSKRRAQLLAMVPSVLCVCIFQLGRWSSGWDILGEPFLGLGC